MNLKLKNTLIITGTLVLGMLIGILICGRFTKVRLDKMKSFYTERGFKQQFIHTVKPTKEQMKQLAPLFKENFEKNRELMMNFRKGKQEIYKNFKEEASEILTPEQMKRLEEFEQRHNKAMRNRKFHNPGVNNRPNHNYGN